MGGPSQSLETQNKITQQQVDIQKESLANSEQDRAQRQELQQPAIDFNKALTSGNPDAVMKAIAPELVGVSSSRAANKESIFESLAPGAARDVALAQNNINAGNQTAGLRANAVSSAFDKLANIGSGLGSFSLQELGASISSGSAASSSNQATMQAENEKKASTLGFLGQLAGAGASVGAAAIKGCWVAESIYGKYDRRTHLVRAWLNGPFMDHWYGYLVMQVYYRYGERTASFLNEHPKYKPMVKPIFDIALRKATRYCDVGAHA